MDEHEWKREKHRTGRLLRQVLDEIQSERFDSAKVTLADLLGDESGRRAVLSALRSAAPQHTGEDTQEIGGPAASRVLRGYLDFSTSDHASVEETVRPLRHALPASAVDTDVDPHAFDDLIVTRTERSAHPSNTARFQDAPVTIEVDPDRLVRVRAQVAEMLSDLQQRHPQNSAVPAADPMRERMRAALHIAETAVADFETPKRPAPSDHAAAPLPAAASDAGAAAPPPPPVPSAHEAVQAALAHAGFNPDALRLLRGVLDRIASDAAGGQQTPLPSPSVVPDQEAQPFKRHAPGAAMMRTPKRREA